MQQGRPYLYVINGMTVDMNYLFNQFQGNQMAVINDISMKCNVTHSIAQQYVNLYLQVKPYKLKDSPLSIVAAILGFFTITAWIGIIFAMVDLCTKKGKLPQRHLGSYFAIVMFGLSLFLFVKLPSGSTESGNNARQEQTADSNEHEEVEASSQQSNAQLSIEDIKSMCVELPYKKIMRNPNEYTGQYFKVNFEVMSVQEGSLLSPEYMKANLYDDEFGGYYGDIIFVFDRRTESDEGYFKILEDDIIEAYCIFEELAESKNSITGEKSETLSLKLLYAELISE